ncbi:MAG TPA: GFA family protein [Burkholderiales bacterium]|nr:GFA family protein [Burkholderiales bacterium]
MSPLTGGCLCGAIRYIISAPVAELRACHCTNCQKASGAAGSVNAVLPASAFQITKGAPKRYSAVVDSGRTLHRFFCGDCGSPLYSQRANAPETVVVRAGSMDDSSGMKITANIWTKSARPWAYIDPASKQLPGQPA